MMRAGGYLMAVVLTFWVSELQAQRDVTREGEPYDLLGDTKVPRMIPHEMSPEELEEMKAAESSWELMDEKKGDDSFLKIMLENFGLPLTIESLIATWATPVDHPLILFNRMATMPTAEDFMFRWSGGVAYVLQDGGVLALKFEESDADLDLPRSQKAT